MKDMSKQAATIVAKGLEKVLKVEANTASSLMSFQPKEPKALKRFRSTK